MDSSRKSEERNTTREDGHAGMNPGISVPVRRKSLCPGISSGAARHAAIFCAVMLIVVLCVFPVPAPADGPALSPGGQVLADPFSHAPASAIVKTSDGLSADATYPHIITNPGTGTINRSYTFRFRDENVTVAAGADASLYYGARNGVKFATAPKGTPANLLAPGYYRAFISDSRQDAFYGNLLANLTATRSADNLTDDEYLELMTDFVQSLPYDTVNGQHPDNPPRFPVETFVDGTGDCDDKSALLAGLLSREGYDVVLFLFIPEQHMAIGVRNSTLAFRDTGYMYVETTGPVLIGEVPSVLKGRAGIATIANSTPLVIPIGNGTKGYTSADKIADILATRNEIDTTIARLQSQMGSCTVRHSCNQTLLLEYDRNAILHNYLVTHSFDQAGLDTYLHPAPVTPAPVQSPGPVSAGSSFPVNGSSVHVSPGAPAPIRCFSGNPQDIFRCGWQEIAGLIAGRRLLSGKSPQSYRETGNKSGERDDRDLFWKSTREKYAIPSWFFR